MRDGTGDRRDAGGENPVVVRAAPAATEAYLPPALAASTPYLGTTHLPHESPTRPTAPAWVAVGLEPVPGYRLETMLGSGGFGEVWKAIGPGGVEVALKFVPLGGIAGEVELKALQVLKNVRHINLLTIFGFWLQEGWLVVAMELADRTVLHRWHEASAEGLPGIPRRELLRYTRDVAELLDFLNKPRHFLGGPRPVGIQHGDIKPQNLLLIGDGVKVGDFGLARVLERRLGSHQGGLTPAYAPPEFFRGETSRHSDQYSLAVTYCQMRTGKLPFQGSMEQLSAGHQTQPPDLTMLPENERPVVLRALEKDPQDRWPNCRSFVRALVECGRPVQVVASAEVPRASPKSRWWRFAVPAVLAVLLGAAGLFWLTQWEKRSVAVDEELPPASLSVKAGEDQERRFAPKQARSQPSLPFARGGDISTHPTPPTPVGLGTRHADLRSAGPSADEGWFYFQKQEPLVRGMAVPFAAAKFGARGQPDAETALQEKAVVGSEVAQRTETPASRSVEGGGGWWLGSAGLASLLLLIAWIARRRQVRTAAVAEGAPITTEKTWINVGMVECEADRSAAELSDLELHLSTAHPSVGKRAPLEMGIVPLRHPDGVWSLAFSSDGRTLLTGGLDGTLRVWDRDSMKLKRSLAGHTGGVTGITVHHEGRLAATSGMDGTVRLWDLANGREVTVLRGHAGRVHAVAFSPDGRLLLSGGEDGTVRLWDVADRALLRVAFRHDGCVQCVAFSPDGTEVASACDEGGVRIWNVTQGETRRLLDYAGGAVRALAWSPDGRTLACGSGDGVVQLRDRVSGDVRVWLRGHRDWIRGIAWTPDGRQLLTGSDDESVRLWDAASGEERANCRVHAWSVTCVTISPDGRFAASASDDQQVRLWRFFL